MVSSLLPDHISPLVDKLRAGDQEVSLPDMAALTEILMRSVENFFKSIDLTIYKECQELADYMDEARQEISSLSPDHCDEAGIPRAGLELAAIVEQTESATNTIMTSAEKIMEADPDDMAAYTATVNDSIMQIFEACSFQDITGQRISKVVNTLENVEDRVSKLVNILGVMKGGASQTDEKEISEDETLLNGPALEGEGIDQSEIDNLLSGKTDEVPEIEEIAEAPEIEEEAKEPVAEEEAKAPTEAESAPNLVEQAKQKKAKIQAEKKEKAEPPKPEIYEEDTNAALDAQPSDTTSQSDIDALFA